jgi:hypothetical protein
MAFKLTYSDGHETEYDDSTKWEVEEGVLKLGREAGKWTAYLSPSHWATLELATGKDKEDGDHKDEKDDDHKDEGKDKKDDGHEKRKKDKDDDE